MTMSIIESNALGDGTFTRASTGTFIGSNGVLQTAAVDVPRLQYNPLALTAAPTLLVEPAVKNELAFSTGFVANWINNGTAGWVDNFGVAPDGTTKTTLISGGPTRYLNATMPANSTVCYSYFAKKTPGASLRVHLDGAGVIANAASIFRLNLETLAMTVVASQALAYGFEDFGSVVRVFCVVATSAAGGSASFHMYPNTGSAPYEAWGAQAEIGAMKPSSYIPTTGTAVTRAADIVSTTGLIYSSVPETDFAVWAAPTAYSVGNKVIRPSTHRIYQRLIAGTTATAPELDTTNWLDIAPTNRWAMFDDKVGTKTTATGSLTVVMRPGGVDGLGMLELVGQTATVVMKDAPGGVVIYNKVILLDGTLVTSFYDWFYKPYQQLTDVVLTDLLSSYVSNELTITISGSSTVSIGVCKFGPITQIGALQYGAKIGISSLSVKSFDAFGNALITKRGFRKIADFSIVTQAADFNGIFRKLSSLDAVACIYVGSELTGYEPFLVYGFFKDFNMSVDYISHHLCTASIEGLI